MDKEDEKPETSAPEISDAEVGQDVFLAAAIVASEFGIVWGFNLAEESYMFGDTALNMFMMLMCSQLLYKTPLMILLGCCGAWRAFRIVVLSVALLFLLGSAACFVAAVAS